jgi:hypothetical protein
MSGFYFYFIFVNSNFVSYLDWSIIHKRNEPNLTKEKMKGFYFYFYFPFPHFCEIGTWTGKSSTRGMTQIWLEVRGESRACLESYALLWRPWGWHWLNMVASKTFFPLKIWRLQHNFPKTILCILFTEFYFIVKKIPFSYSVKFWSKEQHWTQGFLPQ